MCCVCSFFNRLLYFMLSVMQAYILLNSTMLLRCSYNLTHCNNYSNTVII